MIYDPKVYSAPERTEDLIRKEAAEILKVCNILSATYSVYVVERLTRDLKGYKHIHLYFSKQVKFTPMMIKARQKYFFLTVQAHYIFHIYNIILLKYKATNVSNNTLFGDVSRHFKIYIRYYKIWKLYRTCENGRNKAKWDQ